MAFEIMGKLKGLLYQNPLDLSPRTGWGTNFVKTSGIDIKDPLRRSIEKWGAPLANHLHGYNKTDSGTYPIFKYPATPSSSSIKESDRISYQQGFAKKHLTSAPQGWERDGKHSRLINFVDAETSSLKGSNVLSWSRLGVTYNYTTGRFEYVSSEDRFYLSRGGYTAGAEEVNRLNERNIKEFRSRHKVTYSKYYDEKERAYLRSQVAGSVLAGHNILNADVGWLFGNVRGMSTMDTLVAAHNIYGKGNAGLEKLFNRLYKLRPSQLGIQPHLSQHDVLMNALVFEEMLRNAELRKDFSYIDRFVGAEYAPTDYYNGLKSSILLNNQYVIPRGTNIEAKWDVTNDTYYANTIADKYAKAVGAGGYDPGKDVFAYDDEGNRIVQEGFSIVDPGEEGRVDLIGLNDTPEDRATTKWLEEEERKLREASTKKVTIHVKSKSRPIDKLGGGFEETGGSAMEAKEWAEFVAVVKELTRTAGALSTEYRDLAAFKASESRRQAISIAGRISSFENAEDRIDYLNQLGIRGNEQEPYLFMADIQDRNRKMSAKEELFERAENYHAAGLINNKTFERLSKELTDSTVSLKDFKRSINEAVETVESRRHAIQAWGAQRFYDPQQLINVTKGQWGGIQHAASGFVPAPLMRPVGHYGDAVINGMQSTLSGIKKYTSPIGYGAQQVGNLLIGTGAVTLNPVIAGIGLGIKGAAALGTQVYGRYKENQIRQVGEDLQMRLNLVSAGVQTVLLPFQLLAAASRRLLKVFGGLTAAIGAFTYSGLKDMMSMGNPLSNLTGAGYGTYYNTMSGDYASLLAPGSTNAMMENLASGSSRLFTLGQMDENRLLASSMLGAFSNVYSANADSEANITNLINKISKQMRGASPGRKRDLMTWAGMIDQNLPKILQSMDTLGISNYQDFINPQKHGVTWTANRGNAYMENWRKAFQMDQYQFQSINTNIGFNRNRIVHKIWTSFGLQLYDGFNKVVEMIADGRWKEAFDTIATSIKNVIDKIKDSEGFKGFSEAFKEFIDTLKKGKVGDILRSINQTFKEIGIQVISGFMEGIRPFIDFMGDIKFDAWALLQGKNPFSVIDYGKKTMNEASPEAQAALASIRGLLVDTSSSYGPGVTVGKLREKLQSLTLSRDWDTVSAALGITVDDLKDDKTLASKWGIRNDILQKFDTAIKEGTAEQIYDKLHNIGTGAVGAAVSGVSNAVHNIINNNELSVKLMMDGKELAKVFIDASGKATAVGKRYLEASVDKWSR